MLTLNNLQPKKRKKAKRIGRGSGSGRGQKGQRSRSGGKGGLKLLGLKQTFKKIPKTKGFTSPHKKFKVINLKDLEEKYKDGEVVKLRGYKVLGMGVLSKKITVYASAFSKKAEEAIKNKGGEIKKCG